MSYQGSPYSFHIQDDYDMDDDAYDDLDDYRDQDDPHPPTLDDSDEGNHACSISSILSPITLPTFRSISAFFTTYKNHFIEIPPDESEFLIVKNNVFFL